MTDIEKKFNNEMMNLYYTAKREIKYNATRFLRLVTDVGGLQAAKTLISKEDGTYGFGVLWEHGRLNLSVEALVLEDEYRDLFTEQERMACKERLEKYGYEIPGK